MILRTPIDEGSDAPHVVDDREPRHYWTHFNRDRAYPLARGIPYQEWVEGVPRHRHVFDALVVYGPEEEQPDDPRKSEEENWRNPPPNHRPFRMNLTCIECGQIVALEGILTQDDQHKVLAAEPLRAKHLSAQHTSTWGSYRPYAAYAVYDGQEMVGAMSTGMGSRGRVFMEGYVLDADGTKHVAQAPTPIGLLRKLASAHARKPAA
jgi:hypothetical protein